MIAAFDALYGAMPADDHLEPMLNLHASYQAHRWRVIVFPRARHRPSFYSAAGDEQILLSPAAVEMGGVCALPREHGYRRITSAHLAGMFSEVCASAESADAILRVAIATLSR
jgi:hypothetical protein